MSESTLEEWEAWEEAVASEPQRRLDRIRVHGYMLACTRRVKAAHDELERRVTLALRARADAEKALASLRHELEHAEAMAKVFFADDADGNARIALALERLEEAAA